MIYYGTQQTPLTDRQKLEADYRVGMLYNNLAGPMPTLQQVRDAQTIPPEHGVKA